MKSGDVYEVADIVRNLTFKQKEKGLSTTEKKMLLNAKQILVSELVLAEDKDKDEIDMDQFEKMQNVINEGIFEEVKEELLKNNEVYREIYNSQVRSEEGVSGKKDVLADIYNTSEETEVLE